MPASICLPSRLAEVFGNRMVCTEEATVGDALERLCSQSAVLRDQVYSQSGQLNPFVAVMHNGTDIRSKAGLATKLAPFDEVVIITATAGG